MKTTKHLTKILAAAIALPLAVIACGSDEEPGAADPNAAICGATLPNEVPDDLICTGLYTDFATKALSPSARPFAPAVSFWSDGLEKDRFIALPDGTTIDGTNVDEWRFPVGTKVWKEIRQGARKIETRFFWKVKDDFWTQASYVWTEDGTKAVRGEGNDITVNGAPYHVPKSTECNDCHRGRKEKLLGFEAISLGQPQATGLNLATLVAEQRIVPPPARTTVTLPEPAFAALHVNCGITCHNNSQTATAYSTGLRMRLGFDEVATKPKEQWDIMTSTIGIGAKMPGWAGETRIKPGKPDESLLLTVMKLRGEGQMPPIATKVVDAQSIAAVEAWVRGLPAR